MKTATVRRSDKHSNKLVLFGRGLRKEVVLMQHERLSMIRRFCHANSLVLDESQLRARVPRDEAE